MKLEQANKLMLMHSLGYLIKIEDGYYEDQPVTDIREATEEDARDNSGLGERVNEGEIVYDSSVYSAKPLRKVRVEDVKTYIPFDWESEEIDPNNDVTLLSDFER